MRWRLKRYQENLGTVPYLAFGKWPSLRLRVESLQHCDPAQAVLIDLALKMKIRNSERREQPSVSTFGGPLLKREKWRTPWLFLF
jgi:hypothetical protein